MTMPATENAQGPDAPGTMWEISVPLLSNRAIVGGVMKGFGIAALLVCALMTVILGSQGDWDTLPPILLMFAGIFLVFIVLSLLVMAVVFRNRMRFRFTVSESGVLFETIDKTARAVNRLAIVAGVLGGSAQTTGTGLISASQETQEVRWEGAFRAEYRPRSRTIVFRNAWRQLMIVYCTPDNYADVAEQIRAAMERSGTAERVPARSPVGRYVGWSVVATIATLPLFGLVEEFDVSLLLPIGILCFALATIWLIGVFGYVVLAGLVITAWSVAADGLGVRESFFNPGETFARWTVYSDNDWAMIALAGAAFVVLGWISLRGVRGKMPAMLTSDSTDMSG
jgi:Na+-transporting methylmalonyl-CoA/oxaloacetate decarboxylase gamma subunit